MYRREGARERRREEERGRSRGERRPQFKMEAPIQTRRETAAAKFLLKSEVFMSHFLILSETPPCHKENSEISSLHSPLSDYPF
jgi:hypothetical protein